MCRGGSQGPNRFSPVFMTTDRLIITHERRRSVRRKTSLTELTKVFRGGLDIHAAWGISEEAVCQNGGLGLSSQRSARSRAWTHEAILCWALSPSSWGLCPCEIKVTSSTSSTMSAAQVGTREKKSYGPPESYLFFFGQKLAFAESALSRLDLRH